MTRSKMPVQEPLAELLHEVNEIKIALRLITEKQTNQTQRYESVKSTFAHMEKRLHALENFMLASLQRLAFIKALFKFWPVLVATLLFVFSVGIFVDDQKVATEIADKLELKK